MSKRGRPKVPAKNRRTIQVWTRLTPAEAHHCETFVKHRNTTIAKWLYDMVISESGFNGNQKAV